MLDEVVDALLTGQREVIGFTRLGSKRSRQ